MFFERPGTGERAVLVHLNLDADSPQEDPRELEELALSAGADPVEFIFGQRRRPDPRSFVGSGKLEEIVAAVRGHCAELVIFNHALSPSQERNLEQVLECRVIDRTGLILDIFAQRARSHVGKLQVELAQLRHISTRLVRGWTHLERQKGGIGLRGPGETQLETDRRLIRDRIRLLTRRLEKVHLQREQGRRARRRAQVPAVSLVGYTNAGKSTLLNALTGAGVLAEDKLFATLDPTTRRLRLPTNQNVLLSDTVGFIRKLPHGLVESFKATLEEVVEAELLLHVVDSSHPHAEEQIRAVNAVLEEIGAGNKPTLMIFNKVDQDAGAAGAARLMPAFAQAVAVSARKGTGFPELKSELGIMLRPIRATVELEIPHDAPEVTARLHSVGQVLESRYDGDKAWFRAQIPPYVAHEFAAYLVPEKPVRRARKPATRRVSAVKK